jgi:uncharacterized protein DUF4386
MPEHGRMTLVGNRWTLIGAVVYLLEWVAIIGLPSGQTPAPVLMKPETMLAQFSAHTTALAISASWFGLVLLGRILYVAGLRHALRRSGSELVLADVALAAMTASVVIEVISYSLVAAAAQLAPGGNSTAVIALNAAGQWINLMIITPFAVSIAAAAAGQLQSRLFPAWIVWLGLVAGLIGILDGVLIGPAYVVGGTLEHTVMIGSVATLGVWVWMLATGILLWRRTKPAS